MKKFSCPIPFVGLSYDSGLKQRLCCHDSQGQLKNGLSSEQMAYIQNEISNGDIPKNCSSCKELEKLGQISPRLEYIEKFGNISHVGKVKYLDLTLESTCNLACLSCSPAYSSSLENDFKKAQINSSQNSLTFRDIKDGLDKILEKLQTDCEDDLFLTITGGEPSLLKSVPEFIGKLQSVKSTQNMTLRLFTNLTHEPSWIQTYLNSFKKVEVIVSIDAVNDLTRYIRYPIEWDKIQTNLNAYVEFKKNYTNLELSVHTVLSALNFHKIDELIEKIYTLYLDVEMLPKFTILEAPKIFSINNLTKNYLKLVVDSQVGKLRLMIENTSEKKYKDYLNRIVSTMESFQGNDNSLVIEMIIYLQKLDKIRNLNYKDYITYL